MAVGFFSTGELFRQMQVKYEEGFLNLTRRGAAKAENPPTGGDDSEGRGPRWAAMGRV